MGFGDCIIVRLLQLKKSKYSIQIYRELILYHIAVFDKISFVIPL